MATRRTSSRRRRSSGSLGIPGLRLPRGVPTLIRSVKSLFGGSRRKTSAASAADGGAEPDAARTTRIVWIVLVVLLLLWVVWGYRDSLRSAFSFTSAPAKAAEAAAAPKAAQPAPAKTAPAKKPPVWKDGSWVTGSGTVVKLLPDDTTPPDLHQQFMLEEDRGLSLRFAHNVNDPSRRVPLAVGDRISFRGQHVLGKQDGLPCIHWTHADSSGRRQGGWIERDDVRYK